MVRVTSNHDKELTKRSERCVCKFCGYPLTPKFIIFNKYGGQGKELFCENCQRLEYGVEPEIYVLAEHFVDDFDFNYYLDMEENEESRRLNIAKVNELLSWAFHKMSLVDEEGFHNKF